MEKKPRIEWIDNAKAFCIVLIVMGHIGMSAPLTNFFSSFRVPLFFFVSGFLYHYDGLSSADFFKRKFRTLVIPYFLFSLLTYMVWLVFTGLCGVNSTMVVKPIVPLIGIFYSVGQGNFLIHNAPLWFITCLFMVEALYFYALAPLKGGRRWLAVLLMSILGYLCSSVLPFRLPWSADVALIGVLFYGLGRWVRSLNREKLIPSKSYAILLFALCLVCSQLNGRVDMNHLKYGNYLLFYMASISGIGTAIYMAQVLPSNRFCKFFGRHTAPIMAFHLGAINIIHFLKYESISQIYVTGGVPMFVCVVDTIVIFFMLTPLIHGWDKFLRAFLKWTDTMMARKETAAQPHASNFEGYARINPFWT